MESFEKKEDISSNFSWAAPGPGNISSKISSIPDVPDQEKFLSEELFQQEGIPREILAERSLNFQSSSQANYHGYMRQNPQNDKFKSNDLNFCSQYLDSPFNQRKSLSPNKENPPISPSPQENNPKPLLLNHQAGTNVSGERARKNPMNYVTKNDVEYIRNRKVTFCSSSISQLPDSYIFNDFEGEFVAIGKNEFSHKDGKEKVRALIAKELEGFVHVGKLGQGTFSEVELTFDKENKKLYAMKKYPKLGKPFDSKIAENEYRILRKVMEYDHPDLLQVKILCYTPHESLVVLMEYAIGGTLDTLLRYIDDQKGKNALVSKNLWRKRDLMILYQQLINQIKKLAPLGILHCDIKPDNIIIRDDGSFILSDYGCAQARADHDEKRLELELELDLISGSGKDDIRRIRETVNYVIERDQNLNTFDAVRTSSDSSLVKQELSFYSKIKDRYRIDLFKYPFQNIDNAYENILKFCVYFNTQEIARYIQAEFKTIPPENHKELQAFYFFFGDILQRNGNLLLGYVSFKKSEQQLKLTGHEIDHLRAGHLYRKLGLIQMDLLNFPLAFEHLQMSMHHYVLSEQKAWKELENAFNEKVTTIKEKEINSQKIVAKEKALIEKIKQIARTYHWLASLQRDHGNLTESERLFQEEILLFELTVVFEKHLFNKKNFEDLFLISLYYNIGMNCELRGRFEVALNLIGAAVFKYRKEVGLLHPYTGLVLSYLGMVYQHMNHYQKALNCFHLSSRIFIKKAFHQHYYYANALLHMATIYDIEGNKEQALKYYKKSLVVYSKNDIGKFYIYYLKYRIAIISIDLGKQYEKAQEYLYWFVENYQMETLQTQYIIAKIWVNLEFSCKLNGSFTLASQIFHRRMKLIAVDPDECPCFPLIKLQVARNHIVHTKKEEFQHASQLLEETFAQMKKRIFAYFPSQFETCLYYLGHLYYEQEMFEKAHYYFQKCLKIRRLLYQKEPISVSNEEDCSLFLCQLEVLF